jgi:putative nucleotidyltransferase with HDIG domain
MKLSYRLRQFWHSLTAQPLSAAMLADVGRVLDKQQVALFCRMSPADQWHAYRVYDLLRGAGHDDGALLAAALLHDVGKVRADLSVWDRSLAVLGETFAPRRAEAWGDAAQDGWKQTFAVRRHHAAWGAELAADAGAPAEVVELIRRHQDTSDAGASRNQERLTLLQWADGQN